MQESRAASISAIHSDILQTHILTRLNGPTLASLSCTSSQLYRLGSQDALWTNICHSTWPSTKSLDISGDARYFFSESYPLPTNLETVASSSSSCNPDRLIRLISAVDLYYKGESVISKVVETETVSGWFRCSPFRIDLLEPKDVMSTNIKYGEFEYEDTCKNLDEGLRLSWILIDPIGRRTMNLSSQKAVSIQRHWLSGEVHARFAAVLGGEGVGGGAMEHVMCEIMVTCGRCEAGGYLQVREVSLQVEDLDGVHLNGKDSLGILGRWLEGKRGNFGGRREEEGKKRYDEFLEMKRERRERKLRREGRLDSLCVSLGVVIFGVFWMLILFR